MASDGSAWFGTWGALRDTLRTDRWTHGVLAAVTVTAALRLLPLAGDGERLSPAGAVGPVILLGLTVAALLAGLDRLSVDERRFWHDVAGAFGALLASASLRLLFPGRDGSAALELGVAALHAAFYAALVLAAERQPHRTYRWRPAGLERTLAWPAAIAFILALFAYFILVPILGGSPAAGGWISSHALYLVLDAYLAARFLWLAALAPTPRWRTLYLVLGLTLSAVFLADLVALAARESSSPFPGLIAALPCLAVVLARSRHAPFRDPTATAVAEERPETHYTRPSGRTMAHALALPLLHLGGYSLGIFDAAHRSEREVLAFWAALVLGAIGVVQHRMLEQRARALWRHREEVEASLRRNEKDLRMMVERYHADQKLRLSEEKLAKAFRVCPDAMMITSLADGEIKEVNESFELTTGYCREDILGKSVNELGLWVDPEERQNMVRLVELDGAVRDLKIRARTRSGGVIVGLVSVEPLTIDGEPHLLSVTRDITERKRIEENLKIRAVPLE